jgi:lysophospholipase L1-like esterase
MEVAASSSGGSNPSGGALGVGGASAVGGTAAGGSASGGSSSGGASGGSASGGSASGGQGTGGVATDVPITIWLAGDSTMANGNTPCPTGWGKHFADEWNELVTVVNSAAGGRSVRTWLYEVTTEMGTDDECTVNSDANGDPILQARWADMMAGMAEGDYLFIQFGINDGSATCDRHVGLERFKQEYAMMAEVARGLGTTPVFLTPVSSIGCNGTTAIGTRGAYVTATIEAGEENDVPVIDLHQLSVDLYNELAFCPVPGGDVSASTSGPVGDFFCDDHTHFSDAGSVSIGALVAEAISELGLPLAAYLEAD